MHLSIHKIVFGTLAVAAMASASLGQRTTATFAGIVTDPSGAVLPGAEVQFVSEGTAAMMQQLTNETGEFVFDFVPVGAYTLKIGMPGFKGSPFECFSHVRKTGRRRAPR